MKLFWDYENAEIGVYTLKLMQDDGSEYDEVVLRDYTCDFRKNIWKPEHMIDVTFEFSQCDGVSRNRTITDNITLDEAKSIVEKWFINLYVGKLESVKEQVEKLEYICDYLKEWKTLT